MAKASWTGEAGVALQSAGKTSAACSRAWQGEDRGFRLPRGGLAAWSKPDDIIRVGYGLAIQVTAGRDSIP